MVAVAQQLAPGVLESLRILPPLLGVHAREGVPGRVEVEALVLFVVPIALDAIALNLVASLIVQRRSAM